MEWGQLLWRLLGIERILAGEAVLAGVLTVA